MKVSPHGPVTQQRSAPPASGPPPVDARTIADADVSRPYSIGKVASCIEVKGAFGTIRNGVTLGSYQHFVELEQGARRQVIAGNALVDLHHALSEHLATLPPESPRALDVAYLLHVVDRLAGPSLTRENSTSQARVTGRALDERPAAAGKPDPAASPLAIRLSNLTSE